MGESQHNAANAFVKRNQNEKDRMAGHAPKLEDKYSNFDACMMNNGMHAQELASSLTKGLDKEAFPVRADLDRSQD